MSVVSGKDGAVDAIDSVGRWNISSSADMPAIIASNTKGGPVRLAGNKDWTGLYKAFGHTPLKFPGDIFTFTGKMDVKSGGPDTVIGVQGSCMVRQAVIVVDVEAALAISHEVSFEADAALTYLDNITLFSDVTIPAPFTSISMKVEVSDPLATPVFGDVSDIRVVTLTLTRNNPSYVSSDTAGQTRRSVGNFDVELAYSAYQADPTKYIQPNTIKHVRVHTEIPAKFWDLKWMRFGEITDAQVDNESGDHIGATQNCKMHGFAEVPAGGAVVEGAIITPGVVTIWP